jgi:hypothetical protein
MLLLHFAKHEAVQVYRYRKVRRAFDTRQYLHYSHAWESD